MLGQSRIRVFFPPGRFLPIGRALGTDIWLLKIECRNLSWNTTDDSLRQVSLCLAVLRSIPHVALCLVCYLIIFVWFCDYRHLACMVKYWM
jgi:hypothetical protein